MRTPATIRGCLATAVSITILGITAVWATPAQAAPATPDVVHPDATCGVSMDNPHYSSGAGGVISKLRYCNETSVAVATALQLYVCPTYPPVDEDLWPSIGCTRQGYVRYDWWANAWTTYTRYVPPPGQPGAHGTGWWVSCAFINDGGDGYYAQSNPVYLSA